MYRKKGKMGFGWVMGILLFIGPVFQLGANDINTNLDAEKWLENAAACYPPKGGFTAAFEHENISRVNKTGSSSGASRMTGKIWVSSTGLFKMEYQKPVEKRVVFDGKKIRAFDKESNIVVERLPQSDALFLSLLLVLRGSTPELLERFDVRVLPRGKHHSLKLFVLVPKFSTELASKIVITLGDCPVLRRVIVVDRAGNMIRLTFSNIEIIDRFSSGVFKLKAPKDMTVVRP